MSQIKSKNTKPEIIFRKLLRINGLKGYRLHAKIPGKPDIYYPAKKLAIFIDGCFWHGCKKCLKLPKTHSAFWVKKINDNRQRDKKIRIALRKLGIKTIRFWQHEVQSSSDRIIGVVKNSINLQNKA